jgi:glyoxylase-like metal-dependent hydrolase (beta-lactamase superfamily II)
VQHIENDFQAVGQSLRPGPPWDQNHGAGTRALDLEAGIFASHDYDADASYRYDVTNITDADGGRRIDHRVGTTTANEGEDFGANSGPFVRVTPVLLLRQLMEQSHRSHYLGEVSSAGQLYDVVSLVMDVGPVLSLYFDSKTRLLRRSERVLPSAGLVGYRFLDYAEIDGIAFNRRFKLFVGGELNEDRTIKKTLVNVSIAAYTKVDSALIEIAAAQPDAFGLQRLAEGVYLIGGAGTYALFVEMADHVVAVGGTAGFEARAAALAEQVPGKPVRYGVLTHHHSDHVVGAAEYAAAGVTVVAPAAHEAVVRATFADSSAYFEGVSESRTFSDDERELQMIDIGPTDHSEHLLVAWLPKQRILFQADHFGVPEAGPTPPANSTTRSFAKALKRHKLKPRIIVSAHSPRAATMKDLAAALAKKVRRPRKS